MRRRAREGMLGSGLGRLCTSGGGGRPLRSRKAVRDPEFHVKTDLFSNFRIR